MKTQPEHEPLMNKRKTDKMQSFLAMILSLVIALAAALAFRFHFLQNIENIAEDGLYQKPGIVSENIKIIFALSPNVIILSIIIDETNKAVIE